ncbi:MAG: YjbQ family protein [Candidatus Marsarchaeota archaeon]|nr:YjbQ family protein [Candidatus Marsarchaeota archaeon]
MRIETIKLYFEKQANKTEVIDITRTIEHLVIETRIDSGTAIIYTDSPSAAIAVIEYEEGVVSDILQSLDILATKTINGKDRISQKTKRPDIRPALIGSSVAVPFKDNRLMIGKWQNIVLMDFSEKIKRNRVMLQILEVR